MVSIVTVAKVASAKGTARIRNPLSKTKYNNYQGIHPAMDVDECIEKLKSA